MIKQLLPLVAATSICSANEEVNISWDEVHDMVHQVSQQIDMSEYDLLFGVSVGGLVPTTLFSLELGSKNVATVSARSYDGKKQGEIVVTNGPDKENLKGKRILLIDDLVDSGNTIEVIRKALYNEYNVAKVDVACLFMKPHSKVTPDFFAKKSNAWITFPWEIKR